MEDSEKARREHVESFNKVLSERNAERLTKPLTLQDCLAIAYEENYEIKQAELSRQLAECNKDISFAKFLPNVDVGWSYMAWSRQPKRMSNATNDKTYYGVDASGSLPILMPSIWFMYANRKLGQSIAEISARYVRQSVTLDVAIAYFMCLVTEDRISALETQVGAAKSQSERIVGMAKEGLAASWEGEQATCLLRSREIELSIARRELNTRKAMLLKAMGLSPLGQITLERSVDGFELPEAELDELVMTALQQNLALSIADHQIVARENDIRAAIANFLPNLAGFANWSWTSDSMVFPATNLNGGFKAAWNIFSGFAHKAGYDAAKINKQMSEQEREATFISIILEVVKAHASLCDAKENFELAQVAYSAARSKYLEYESKQKEGLVTLNDMLEAQADMDKAQSALAVMKYQCYLAVASLKMVMGAL